MDKPKKIIKYKNSQIKTKHYCNLSEEKFKELRELYYNKPKIEEVIQELIKINNGKNKQSKINRYYFRDLMAKVRLIVNPWTIEEVLKVKKSLEYYTHL